MQLHISSFSWMNSTYISFLRVQYTINLWASYFNPSYKTLAWSFRLNTLFSAGAKEIRYEIKSNECVFMFNIFSQVFRKARNKAKEEINKQLEEFCNKRTAGLGSMFGPPDSQLEECLADKTKEVRILETYLVPRLESYWYASSNTNFKLFKIIAWSELYMHL